MAILPTSPDDHVTEDNPARVVGAFIGEPDPGTSGFDHHVSAETGRSA